MNAVDDKTRKILSELEQTQTQFWNISKDTANFMNMMIKVSNSKNVLEIGTSNGYSAINIALALRATNGRLTTIEFWDKRLSLAKLNFEQCGLADLIVCKQGSAVEVLESLDEEFDAVFIDANKSEYLKYFELIHPKLKKGGLIFADNVLSHQEKVKPFVDEISSHEEYQVQILDLPAGLLMALKK